MAKGDFYLLGVQMRLLIRCKILDVASFLHCLHVIFSLKSRSRSLRRHMDLPVHGFVDYKFLFHLNYKLITRATLLALAKSLYYV